VNTDAPRPSGWRSRLKVAAAAAIGTAFIRVLAATWRVRREGDSALQAVQRAEVPVVFVLWHEEILPLLWAHRHEGIAVLVSTHADGEIIARISAAFGCRTVRGSSSRGGSRALLDLVKELSSGHDVAVTPDGPRGPRRSFAPGAVVAAMRARAPVVALSASVDRAWRLRSWDRFVIPKPFARVVVRYSAPTRVDATTPRGAEQERPRFEELLRGVCGADEP